MVMFRVDSPVELAGCFSTALHQENLGVIWERLGIGRISG